MTRGHGSPGVIGMDGTGMETGHMNEPDDMQETDDMQR
jgi:hypothetical protein